MSWYLIITSVQALTLPPLHPDHQLSVQMLIVVPMLLRVLEMGSLKKTVVF